MRFGTQLIHNAGSIDPATGALGTPIFQTSTFDQGVSFRDESVTREFDYARSGIPHAKLWRKP
jgi:cystathionine beta-lyase